MDDGRLDRLTDMLLEMQATLTRIAASMTRMAATSAEMTATLEEQTDQAIAINMMLGDQTRMLEGIHRDLKCVRDARLRD
jgi:methyl-accepting chemotaxis protein